MMEQYEATATREVSGSSVTSRFQSYVEGINSLTNSDSSHNRTSTKDILPGLTIEKDVAPLGAGSDVNVNIGSGTNCEALQELVENGKKIHITGECAEGGKPADIGAPGKPKPTEGSKPGKPGSVDSNGDNPSLQVPEGSMSVEDSKKAEQDWIKKKIDQVRPLEKDSN
ncbi:hypothetical protein GC174_17025 [bacterium]|nr:hypothetical protein [bacterium]